MKKFITLSTVLTFAVAGALLVAVGFAAPKSDATTSLCHAMTLAIKAPATAKPGSTVTVKGTAGQAPSHAVKATLQYRKATATAWKNGATASMSAAGYSLTWKVPAAKATYKVRVRLTHLSASRISAAKTVVVK
jgi:hypothetical protein